MGLDHQLFDQARRNWLRGSCLSLGASMMAESTQSSPAPTDTQARATVTTLLRALVTDPDQPVTGVSVAWMQGNKPALRAWAGWRSVGLEHPQGSLPVDAQTFFRVASLAKLAQALACLRLHEAGLLPLDEDLSATWGRELRHPLHPQVPITARLLLSHRSGLVDRGGLPLASGDALRQALADPSHWNPDEPGRHFRYSNFGSAVLGTVMEAAAGQSYDALMRHWLFEPLGVQAAFATAALTSSQRHQLATLYRRPEGSLRWLPQADARGEPPHPFATATALAAVGENASVHSPQGGMRINLPGLVRLAQLIMFEGRWEGHTLLSKPSMLELTRPQWTHSSLSPGETVGGLFRSWTVGLQRFTDVFDAQGGDRLHSKGGVTALGHLGFAYGLHAGLLVLPAQPGREARGLVYVINGTSQAAAESNGRHSSFRRVEERIIETLLNVLGAPRQGA